MKKERIKGNKTNMWVAIVATLAIFSACILAGLCSLFVVNKSNKNKLENLYNSYAYTLYDSLNNLETGLSKLMVSPDEAQNIIILLDCYRQAEVAESAVSSLPIELDGENFIKIINQIGDYTKSYSASLCRHKDCAKFEKSVKDFYDSSVELKSGASQLIERVNKGEKITSMGRALYKAGGANNIKTHHSVEYPELIYDGPFSDGKQPKHFKLLENKAEVTQEDAIKMLREKVKGMEDRAIVLSGTSQGDEPCYEFVSAWDGVSEAYFSVSVKGGLLVGYSVNREFKKGKFSEGAVRAIAEQSAEKLGYSVKSVWYNQSSNVATVNLAPIIDGIIFYPDLVKARVALDNGELVGIEASGYCLNSCARNLKPTMNAKSAESMVSKKINIIETRLAVIPCFEQEILCYEVVGEYDGLQYFIYIDAFNGEEVKILRVVDSYQGKLTL